jgi:hypothetical protein
MPPQGAPPQAPPEAGAEQPQGAGQKGVADLVAGIGSDMMQLSDIVSAKFPDEGQKLGQIIQAYQAFVDGLSSGPGGGDKPQGPPPGNVPPEAGAAAVKPVM